MDIVFALDADSLVSSEILNWMKVSTQYLTSGWSSRFSKYGVVSFSNKINTVIEYSEYQSQSLVAHLKSISGFAKHPSIQAKPSVVINRLYNLVDTSMSTATKIGLVLVDDDTDNDEDLQSAAAAAWGMGLNLIALGVGTRVDQQEISSIAKFKTDHYLYLRDWEKLNTEGFSWAINTFQNCKF